MVSTGFVASTLVFLVAAALYSSIKRKKVDMSQKSKYFEKKSVWVVGASSGIGEALAYEFASYGSNVILSSRNVDLLNKVKNNCKAISEAAVYVVPFDVTDTVNLDNIYTDVKEKVGAVDVMLYCSGLSHYSKFCETDTAEMLKLIDVDLGGAIAMTRLVINDMIARKSGHLVAIGSVKGRIPMGGSSAYSAAKFGLRGLFECLKTELTSTGVTSTLITAGFVNTNLKCIVADGEVKRVADVSSRIKNVGFEPGEFAKLVSDATYLKKREIIVGHFKVHLGFFLQRYLPIAYRYVVRQEWKMFQEGKSI